MSYNAIEINSMTRTYANLAKCFAPNRMQPAGPGFADKIADKLEGLDPPAVSPKLRPTNESCLSKWSCVSAQRSPFSAFVPFLGVAALLRLRLQKGGG